VPAIVHVRRDAVRVDTNSSHVSPPGKPLPPISSQALRSEFSRCSIGCLRHGVHTPKVCEPMPVVLLDHDLPLNELSQAPVGLPFTFTVDGTRAKGWTGSTAVAGAKVSVSYGDGATWKQTKVLRKDSNSLQALLWRQELAATNGFVTLRAEAWDAAGNRTTQTITQAYALK
jgi:hypothetical protein